MRKQIEELMQKVSDDIGRSNCVERNFNSLDCEIKVLLTEYEALDKATRRASRELGDLCEMLEIAITNQTPGEGEGGL